MSENPYKEQIVKGEALFVEGFFEEALEIFKMVLTVDPTNVDAMHDAGLTCLEMGDTLVAAKLFERVLELDPTHKTAFFSLLDILAGSEAIDLAAEAFIHYGGPIEECPEKEHYKNGLIALAQAAIEEAEATSGATAA